MPEIPICDRCGSGLALVPSCTSAPTVVVGGAEYSRDTDGYDRHERCHDCGIVNEPGNLHHEFCDQERCPACGGQMVSCDCDHYGSGNWREMTGVASTVCLHHPQPLIAGGHHHKENIVIINDTTHATFFG